MGKNTGSTPAALTGTSSVPPFDCRRTAAVVGGLAAVVIAVIAVMDRPLAVVLVAEHSIVERLQVAFFAAAAVLTARYAWTAAGAGRAIPLEVGIVTALVMACVSEVDLDRALFGIKVIARRFFVSPRYPPGLRILAFIVVVGIPAGVGIWMLTRWRVLRADIRAALREPWGQTLAFGIVLYAVAQTLERPIDRIWWNPHHLVEEAAELVGALCVFVALAARHGLGTRYLRASSGKRFGAWLARTRGDNAA